MPDRSTDHDLAASDLGPLAWVMDELRKSLEAASVALRRFVRDAQAGADEPDAGALRQARQQLHQAVGALEMVGLVAPAQVLRSMECAVQAFADKPSLCTEEAAQRVERAGFAVAQFLGSVLAGKAHSAVALFPQYREVQSVWGADRVHPADLWALDWAWQEPPAVGLPAPAALDYAPPVRARMDQAVLRIVKSDDRAAAREVADVCAGLAAGESAREPRSFWWLAAGFFEAFASGLLPGDVYVKRAASRVLLQYAQLAKGNALVSERLAQDLAFFCAQAVPATHQEAQAAQRLAAVRTAWSLDRHAPVDYEQARFGRFDPALLAQASKRLAALRDGWAALSGGDAGKARSTADHFAHVCDALAGLHESLSPLAHALSAVSDTCVAQALVPGPELAMETATAILFLETVVQDFDPADPHLAQRAAQLAQRLEGVCQGQPAQPLESWMEELYRRMNDRQNLGSVVGELGVTLGELEKALDAYFRHPQDRMPLGPVPAQLSQVRGVLSVLGLDQAAQAVSRMKDVVQALLMSPPGDPQGLAAPGMESLGNSLGALGFLVDMLAYQPALARKLFVLDEASGELRPVMGRVIRAEEVRDVAPADLPPEPEAGAEAETVPETETVPEAETETETETETEAESPVPVDFSLSFEVVESPPDAGDTLPAPDDDDTQMRAIFLDEAREVIQAGHEALDALAADPAQADALTVLRRAFHTLKGSARMVGLHEFGEAAWSMEQVLNAWLAEHQPATPDLLALAGRALAGLAGWVEDIAAGQEGVWTLDMFREPADAFRLRQEDSKSIGPLRISVPLFNVYLHEADEWSQRLEQDIAQWAADPRVPVPESLVPLAHSLAGSSATVGFHALSGIARLLELSLQRAQVQAWATPQHAQAWTGAAEEIRSLLHQFAAGFLKEPRAEVLEALRALDALDVPPRMPAAAVEADIEVTEGDLFPYFEEEALELLPRIAGALREWHAAPGRRDVRDEVLRGLHTLKGSARLAGLRVLGEMAHDMESAVEALPPEVGAGDVMPVLHRFDALQAAFDALRQPAASAAFAQSPAGDQEAISQASGEAWEDVAEATNASANEEADEPTTAKADEEASAEITADFTPQATSTSPAQEAPAPAVPPSRTALAPPVATQLAPQRAAAGHAVRVRSQLLDRMMNQAGEVMITRSRLEAELGQLRGSLHDLTSNLDRLRRQLRDIELQAELQMQSRMAQAKDAAGFDPLEFDRFTRVQELTRMMAESVNDVATVQRQLQRTVQSSEDDLIAQARQTRELQRDLLRTRMVEFDSIADRLHRVVRQAATETGKHVHLDIQGGRIEMDRGVLERMTPAFEHLLRNAVAHGIEPPGDRVAAGKPPTGSIRITLAHEGNDVSLTFLDDGAGLDLGRIREKAFAQGLLREGELLDEEGAANLIFLPGFSTAGEVTELAGRGIGMDVVRAEVNALGGRIETASRTGQGLRFQLVLPLTTAVTQVVMVRCGALTFGLPAQLVELIHRASAREVQQAYNAGHFAHQGHPPSQEGRSEAHGEGHSEGPSEAREASPRHDIPFHWAGALLRSSRRSSEPQQRAIPVVVLRSAAQRVALHVDEVLGHQEVVVKNLGPQLARLPGLAGMTVLPSGAVVLIYNPVALAAVYGEQARQFGADQAQPHMLGEGGGQASAPAMPAAQRVPLVLVVDDSITVRRVTQRLLQREGWRVATAIDGLQALEKLEQERPAVVLSDIEMPRMDGFDLLRNIRGDARWSDLPVIMITSRIATKHRDHAFELGASHYLGKPYPEEELLALVRRYASADFLTTE